MVPALRVRWAKPVNEREVNTQGGHGFNSRRLHFGLFSKQPDTSKYQVALLFGVNLRLSKEKEIKTPVI